MSRAIIAEKAMLASEKAKEFLSGGGGVVSRARSLVLGDAQFFSVQPKLDDLRCHLDSDSLHEKQNAMKRIIAQMCKGNDMSALFTAVVKNIHNSSIELRRLIYFYITHYAEDRPNEALLSISAFQKDLMDSSMHVRSLALRMLSSIRIPAIRPLVMVAVKKCVSDFEPLVRKTAAISLAQMHSVGGGEEDIETTYELLQQLLADRSMEVASAAALSFMEICPDKMEFIHPVYRDLCRSLLNCDEWGQVVLLHVLMRYVRKNFCDPNCFTNSELTQFANGEKNKKTTFADRDCKENSDKKMGERNNKDDSDDDYTDEDEDFSSSSFSSSAGSLSAPLFKEKNMPAQKPEEAYEQIIMMESDHRLFLDSVRPLFMSLNSAVVVAATSVFYHCASKDEIDVCVRPLMRLLGGPAEHHSIVLAVIYTIVLSLPRPFIPYVRDFFFLPSDVREVRELKTRIMSRLVTQDNLVVILQEFRVYLRSFYVDWVINAVRGLGLIASQIPTCAPQIMRLLSPLMSHKSGEVVSESIFVLRLLAVRGTSMRRTCRLIYYLLCQVMNGEIVDPAAKANIFWLVGENIQHNSAIATAAPECFRLLVKRFAQETTDVKKQILMLGLKIWIVLDGTSAMAERFKKLFFYAFELARFDDDYEVRDCARLVLCAVDRQSITFAALKEMLLSEKPFPQSNDPCVERTQYQLGTLSHFFGSFFCDNCELPPWSKTPTDPLLRGRLHDVTRRYNDRNSNDNSSDIDNSSNSSASCCWSDVLSTESSSGSSETEYFYNSENSESQQTTSYVTSFSSDSSNTSNSNNKIINNNNDNANDYGDENNFHFSSSSSLSFKEEKQKDIDEKREVAVAMKITTPEIKTTDTLCEKKKKQTDRILVNVVVRHFNPDNPAVTNTTTTTTDNAPCDQTLLACDATSFSVALGEPHNTATTITTAVGEEEKEKKKSSGDCVCCDLSELPTSCGSKNPSCNKE